MKRVILRVTLLALLAGIGAYGVAAPICPICPICGPEIHRCGVCCACNCTAP
jgi:hypothetical protein